MGTGVGECQQFRETMSAVHTAGSRCQQYGDDGVDVSCTYRYGDRAGQCQQYGESISAVLMWSRCQQCRPWDISRTVKAVAELVKSCDLPARHDTSSWEDRNGESNPSLVSQSISSNRCRDAHRCRTLFVCLTDPDRSPTSPCTRSCQRRIICGMRAFPDTKLHHLFKSLVQTMLRHVISQA